MGGPEMLAGGPEAAMPARMRLLERVIQPCAAELLGTAFFVLMGCVSVIETPEAGSLTPALAHGLTAAALITCMAEISGAHFNPCVTVSVFLCGGMELRMVLPYLISQLTGALLGALTAKGLTSDQSYTRAHGGAFALLRPDEPVLKALLAEAVMTALLLTVALLSALNGRSRSPLAPLAVGSTLLVCVLVGGGVSGSCLNPARALGPALLSGSWTHHWIYWAGPLIGALAAAAILRFLLGDNKTRLLMK